MPSKPSHPEAVLFHIRDNILLARQFVEGFDYERFRHDQLVFYGVTRALELPHADQLSVSKFESDPSETHRGRRMMGFANRSTHRNR